MLSNVDVDGFDLCLEGRLQASEIVGNSTDRLWFCNVRPWAPQYYRINAPLSSTWSDSRL